MRECDVLRRAREFFDISQSEMAAMIGVCKSYMSEVEAGKRAVTLKLIRKYATALGIAPSCLLFIMESMSGEKKPEMSITGLAARMLEWIEKS